jgi:response regulator RpfG family c-di-GMP phosphodiesterase
MTEDNLFADEIEEESDGGLKLPKPPGWKVLIADDEEEVHSTTRLVLGDFDFEGRGLEFISAYSGAEALAVMKEHTDIAVILLDVVMETNSAGLDTVKIIREELQNNMVRIILRTGQPGQAPERKVITDFDINDYKDKTELTVQRLFTALYSALRSYRDLTSIDRNRTGLKYIIDASGSLFQQNSLKKLAKGVLTQIISLLGLQNSIFIERGGFTAAQGSNGELEIIATTGKYAENGISNAQLAIAPEMKSRIRQVAEEESSRFFGNDYVGHFPTQKDKQHIIYLENCGERQDEQDIDLLKIFTTNVGIAFDNVYLNQEIIDTQKEVIQRLGEVVESRSKETAFHVVRVAEYIGIIAEGMGLSEKDTDLLKLASPMHDIGKIGIPDSILLKPGHLNDDEFAMMKTHAYIGYRILKGSTRKLLKTAAVIAYTHHERWDGSGYPRGLAKDKIPLYGRITCFADIFDALLTDRVYKKAWSVSRVEHFITEQNGKTFDPEVVEAYVRNRDKLMAVREQYRD